MTIGAITYDNCQSPFFHVGLKYSAAVALIAMNRLTDGSS